MGEQLVGTSENHFGVMVQGTNARKRSGDFIHREEQETQGAARAPAAPAASAALFGSFSHTGSRKRQRSQSGDCVECVDLLWQEPSFRNVRSVENAERSAADVVLMEDGHKNSADQSPPPRTEEVNSPSSSVDEAPPAPKAVAVGCSFFESESDKSHRMAFLSSRGYLLDDSLMRVMDASVYEDQEDDVTFAADDDDRGFVHATGEQHYSPSELEFYVGELRDVEGKWLGQAGLEQVAAG